MLETWSFIKGLKKIWGNVRSSSENSSWLLPLVNLLTSEGHNPMMTEGNILSTRFWRDEGFWIACPAGGLCPWAGSTVRVSSTFLLSPLMEKWEPPSQCRMSYLNLIIDVMSRSLMKVYWVFKLENPRNNNVQRILWDSLFSLVWPMATITISLR